MPVTSGVAPGSGRTAPRQRAVRPLPASPRGRRRPRLAPRAPVADAPGSPRARVYHFCMSTPGFPVVRPRRLRANPLVRDMVRETSLDVRDFILPLFVRPGSGVRQEISSMPGNYQLSVDRLVDEVGS